MYKSIVELKNKHKEEDIWIITAGSSMDYVSKDLFDNKITISVNDMVQYFKSDYLVMKDCMKPKFAKALKCAESLNIPLLFTKYHEGKSQSELNKVNNTNSYIFDHNPKIKSFEEEVKNLKENEIINSRSTVTTAMHIAAYMGAKNIILCGHDCGTINGNLYYKNYLPGGKHPKQWWGGLEGAISQYEYQTSITCDYLKRKYNSNVVSLNPFINFNLGGNKYIPTKI